MRTQLSIKNAITQFITNVITIILLFVGQNIFIKILGIQYTGLNGLFSNILTLLNLFELGIGSSITYNLYKYTKNNDVETIKSIMYFYKKAYNYIAKLILVMGLITIPSIKYIIKDITIDINIYIVYILFLLSTVATYINSYKRNIIIANQKNYIINIIEIIYIIVLNMTQISVLYITKNYYLYLIIKIICTLLENIIISIRANKLYPFLKEENIKALNKEVKSKITNRIKALFIHRTAGTITSSTDNILISAFLGITTAGLYANYNYILNAVKKLFLNIVTSTSASIGDLLLENNYNKNYNIFKKIEFLNFWIAVFTSTSILLLTEPFIKIWIGEQYLLKKSILLILVINFFQTMMRTTYNMFKESAGIWIEDRYVPIIQCIMNIVTSIVLLKIMGLAGVFLGTIISSLCVWIYSYPKYVYKKLFKRQNKQYTIDTLKHIVIFTLIMIISYTISSLNPNLITNLIISLLLPNIILYVIYRNTKEFKYYKKIIKTGVINHE